MAVYTPTSLGIKAPTGGFAQGGWYSGRQYWNGTLSDPGSIHQESNQQGAGQAVSNEVIAQTNPNNVGFIQQEQQKAQANPVQPAPTVAPTNFSQAGTTGQSTGAAPVVNPQPSINLPQIYENLYAQSGIKDKEAEYTTMEKSFIEAKGKINDNPFLSEATRVGREAKLQKLFDERTANIRNEIATKKADIEMQLNLQTKQFDINTQQAQLALSQFNSLLEMGALNSASGEDIANITRSTGLSSQMIQAAVQANKVKGYSSSTQTFDDGTNEGFIIYTVDQMGNVVNQVRQVTGKSSKLATQYGSTPALSDYISSYVTNQKSGGVASGKDQNYTPSTTISSLWP
jgi:hypothetical protein